MSQQFVFLRVFFFLYINLAFSQGLLTDFSEYRRGVYCSSNGYFDTVIPVIQQQETTLQGIGLSCSSGELVIEGKGKEKANREAPYFFGQQPSSQFDSPSGSCEDMHAISGLQFQYYNASDDRSIASFSMMCSLLKDTSQIYVNDIFVNQNEKDNQDNLLAVDLACQEEGIVQGFSLHWTGDSPSILQSIEVINCRQIKPKSNCEDYDQFLDVSCQGISNDCCSQLEMDPDIYSCNLAGQSGLHAWYTKQEISDQSNLCSQQDELTENWFSIQSFTGICLSAISETEAQVAACDASNHAQWFRFIGNDTFKQLENGQQVGKCLQAGISSSQVDSEGYLTINGFQLLPCDFSDTEWTWSDASGLNARMKELPLIPRTSEPDIANMVYVLEINEGEIRMRSSDESSIVSTPESPRPNEKSVAQQFPKVKDSAVPSLTESSSVNSDPQFLLPEVRTTGDWTEEVSYLRSVLLELDQKFSIEAPTSKDARTILAGPDYCDSIINGIHIGCDFQGRVISLKLNHEVLSLDKGQISPFLFHFQNLRNVDLRMLGLQGVLPNIDPEKEYVIREILLSNNSLAGTLPTEWSQLESLILLNLSNNGVLEVVPSWRGARAFGISTQIILDDNQCVNNNFTCESQLVQRFPCVYDQCDGTIIEVPGSSKKKSHIAAIIGGIAGALVIFIIIILILFLFVIKRNPQENLGTMDTQLGEDGKYDMEKGHSGHLTPIKNHSNSGEPTLLERYLQDEGVVTWNTPPQYVVDWEIDYERDLKPKATLGVGAMGTVQLAEWTDRSSGEKKLVAVKVFSRYLQPIYKDAVEVLNQKLILREVEILMRVQHPNIVRCLGAILKPPNMGLVLEYMDVGNLDKYLHNICSAHPINNRDKLIIMKQIARALDHLHPSVVHRDLKPQNILINTRGEVKLSDFGLSKIRQLQDAGRASSLQVIGTAPYTSPEVFRSNGLNVDDEKVDIYSLGVIMWEIWTMQRPWEGENMVAISYKVVNEQKRPEMPSYVPPRLKTLIESCWEDDPQRRPSARDVQRMLEWMIEETNFTQSRSQELRDPNASGSLDGDSAVAISKADSADHINVPADENHESVVVTFIYSSGEICDGEFEWRDSLLLLTDEVNDFMGYEPDGDTSRFRLHRIIEIEKQDPQVMEIDLSNISDTLQHHGFFTRNKIYVELLKQDE
eukprot:TRINITY_DN3511_c0_g1_i5.p1 TRINITY_DN3511_c0_g1~~TRINITY_DN3511_c0_g1_i5.p1  ORF type:complete len:1180 (-),score=146.37 TRINITY_DN3511_c0_g1_i5:1032-4571(-)